MPPPLRLVFYGTLQRGERNFDRLGVAERLRFVAPCRVAGQLIDLGDYPGFVHGDGTVVGELWELVEPAVVAELDRLEDFRPGDPTGSLYLREPIALLDPAGMAEIYRYNGAATGGPLIPAGDWIAYRKQR